MQHQQMSASEDSKVIARQQLKQEKRKEFVLEDREFCLGQIYR